MINLWWTFNNEEIVESQLWKMIKLLPPCDQLRIRKYTRWKDRQAFLLARMIILEKQNHIGITDRILEKIKYTKYGRPFIENLKADFNITHSGDVIALVTASEGKIGIDVEAINEIKIDDFKDFFSNSEFDILEYSENRLLDFYRLWTAKEAILKADGSGLSKFVDLNLKITQNFGEIDGKQYHFKFLDIADGYVCCIATSRKIDLGLDIQINLVHPKL
ncbi:hypothetical protein GCM10022289_47310 [Pedobacter jeongneungensis]|uniref:4'-phosphopantetheinyl transferase n=1 Tax=Pedobacter jeongneungensis TaxID=947309 RepID=A0ABP8BQM1_9SPHI